MREKEMILVNGEKVFALYPLRYVYVASVRSEEESIYGYDTERNLIAIRTCDIKRKDTNSKVRILHP